MQIISSKSSLNVYRGTITGLRISAVDGGATASGGAFVDALPAAVYDVHNSVSLTAAASGSSGITVADNDNVDFGTGNFTLVWKGSLPDWTPSGFALLIEKWEGNVGYSFAVDHESNGKLRLYYNAAEVLSTTATSISDGAIAEVSMAFIRETAGANGSVTFYVNGVQLGSPIAVTAAATATVSSITEFAVSGQEPAVGVRTASTTLRALTYNRALTAAEVLSLYNTGIAASDKWGSQTSLVTGDNSTFTAGVGDWENGAWDAVITNPANDMKVAIGVSAGDYARVPVIITAGKRYRLSVNVKEISNTQLRPQVPYSTTWDVWTSIGVKTTEFTATTSDAYLYFTTNTGDVGDYFVVDDVTLTQIGATLALESSGIKQAGWTDSSDNSLDASYPAAGSTLNSQYLDGTHSIEIYPATTPSGRMLKGVLKAVGSAEGLDTSVATNGADWTGGPPPTGWNNDSNGTSATVGGGEAGNCLQVTGAATLYAGAVQSITTEIGALYKNIGSIKDGTASGKSTNMGAYSAGWIGLITATTTSSWVSRSAYGTATKTGYDFYVQANGVAHNTTTLLYDTVSFSKVLTPSTSGSTIVSTKSGTTFNWAVNQFQAADYNQASYICIVRKLR